ncbi:MULTISPECIES: glutamyl-tRNA reductase [unclassified Luteococcus]|uniref:glutamyl-tRNA reductase n=1 Tax=unclassified Luteococcus TaxID=2639923 RepID=UPI00313BA111
MTLLAISINHRTAGLDLLARTSMDNETSRALARSLAQAAHVSEALVLSTCNRTEVYLDTDRFHAGLEAVAQPLARRAGVERAALPEVCRVYYDEAAVKHCFGLVAGLDSLVVGENQILGQVREALSNAQDDHTSGPAINQLFQTALRVGKRVQSETSIGAAGRSVLSAALEQLDGELDAANSSVLVIGAGAMAGLAARTLAGQGATVDCANRTLAKAERLATEVGGVAIPMSQLGEAVAAHDIVVTCTGASGSLISAQSLADGPAPRIVIDLAMPPDVDENVAQKGVRLVNLASLKAASEGSDELDVEAARRLVSSEVTAFLARQRAQAVTPTVVALRQMATGVVDQEMARLERRVRGLDEHAAAEIHNALNRVAEKLIHSPTVRVREFAGGNAPVDYAAALRALFSLEGHTVALSDPDDCPPEARRAVTEQAEGLAVPALNPLDVTADGQEEASA